MQVSDSTGASWAVGDKQILTTIHAPEVSWWTQRADMLSREAMSRTGLLRQVVTRAPRYRSLILKGSVALQHGYNDLIAGGLAARRSAAKIVFDDCAWEVGSAALQRLFRRLQPAGSGSEKEIGFARAARAAIRAVDSPRTYYCVQSDEEVILFPERWQVEPHRVVYVPWFASAPASLLDGPVSHDGPVFAGGDSMRDYGPLVEAARRLPDVNFAIASLRLDGAGGESLPDNLTAGYVPHERFLELLRGASVVVAPIDDGGVRAGGQQTYLNALAMGKAVVITDTFGVRKYVSDEEHALIVPPRDPDALERALRWVVDTRNVEAVTAMRERARRHVRERFTFEHHLRCLLAVAEG